MAENLGAHVRTVRPVLVAKRPEKLRVARQSQTQIAYSDLLCTKLKPDRSTFLIVLTT